MGEARRAKGHVVILRLRRTVRQAHQSDGFTLLEMVISLVIATIIFSALAAALLAGVRATTVSRVNQSAGDVLNAQLEAVRSFDYSALAMATTDLSVNDTAVTTGTPRSYVVPGGVGSEPVFTSSAGSINPHVTTVSAANGVTYTVRRYVTVPTDASVSASGVPSQKRVTVVVSWQSYGVTRTRVSSTIVADAQRGLPSPRFSVTPTSSTALERNPNTTVTWGFYVSNVGAPDTFNIGASAGTWAYYRDPNCNGSRDSGEDTTLSNTDSATGNTQPDTGELGTNNAPYCLTAQRVIGATETGISTVTFTVRSSKQPSSATGTVTTPGYALTVVSGVIGGGSTTNNVCGPAPAGTVQGTGTSLQYLGMNNGVGASVGATVTQTVNELSLGICPVQTGDFNYSTEVITSADQFGRAIAPGGSDTSTVLTQVGEWRWSPPVATIVNGTAALSVMARCTVKASSAASNPILTAALGTFSERPNNGQLPWVQQATGSATMSCTQNSSWGNWQRVIITMPVTEFAVATTNRGRPQYLSLRVWSVGGSTVRVNYESPNAKSFLVASVG